MKNSRNLQGTKFSLSECHRQLKASVAFLRKHLGNAPETAMVMGSGLGASLLRDSSVESTWAYKQIPHFPHTAVAGHRGELHILLNPLSQQRFLVLEGRCHAYEGWSAMEIAFPYRVLALWGVKRILLTNASGALVPRWKPGQWVLLKDHLNCMGSNPLVGPNLDFLGTRFPALHGLYQGPLTQALIRAARVLRISLPRGIYAGVLGPSYETLAELKALRRLGADLVGMSTVPEAIVCAHGGMEVAALAVVTNQAGKSGTQPSHQEVLQNAQGADQTLARLLKKVMA